MKQILKGQTFLQIKKEAQMEILAPKKEDRCGENRMYGPVVYL